MRSVAVVLALCVMGAVACSDSREEPALSFSRERVVLRVLEDSLEVEGWYTMQPGSSMFRAAPLFYPFPDDSRLGGARMLLVEARGPNTDWVPLPVYQRPPRGVRWTLPLDLGDSIVIHAVYRQALHDHYARYIVLSTRSWGHPLNRARFEIVLPPDAREPEFSHPFRRVPSPTGPRFVFEARSFWPEQDIWVTWQGGPPSGPEQAQQRGDHQG